MISPTSSYTALVSSTATAKRLWWRVPTLIPVTDTHHLKIRSVLFLCHAAIEQYLEEISENIAVESVNLLKTMNVINVPMISLFNYYKIRIVDLNAYSNLPMVFRDLMYDAADEVLSTHLQAISDNHGIKIKNHNKLLEPIGLKLQSIDSTLSANLEAFGSKRGGVAHAARITTVHTKSDIQADIASLVRLLKGLDIAGCKAFGDRISAV